MYILAGIIIFILGSIGAASKGDFSGIAAIGKFLLGFGLFFFVACILTGFSTEGSGGIFLFSIIAAVIGFFMTLTEE